jgi:hypothetical protein
LRTGQEATGFRHEAYVEVRGCFDYCGVSGTVKRVSQLSLNLIPPASVGVSWILACVLVQESPGMRTVRSLAFEKTRPAERGVVTFGVEIHNLSCRLYHNFKGMLCFHAFLPF